MKKRNKSKWVLRNEIYKERSKCNVHRKESMQQTEWLTKNPVCENVARD